MPPQKSSTDTKDCVSDFRAMNITAIPPRIIHNTKDTITLRVVEGVCTCNNLATAPITAPAIEPINTENTDGRIESV